MYVIDASLQDGKKIPKWNPWARLGLFLGFSDIHSSLVPLVLNVETGHISPQFHVIFDDKFETVNSLAVNQPLDRQWADIFWLGRECFLDMDYDANGLPILPLLSDIINSYPKAKAGQPIFEPIQPLDFDNINGKDSLMPPPPRDFFHDGQAVLPLDTPTVTQTTPTPELLVPEDIVDVPSVPGLTFPGGVDNLLPSNASPVQDLTATGRPQRNVGTYKDGPAKIRCLPIDGKNHMI